LKLEGYEINELIYEGKETLIYRGYNKEKEKNVILKTLHSDRLTLKNIEKLKHEYEMGQKVNGIKGVVKVYDIKKHKGRIVLIKEDFIGNSLKQLIKSREIKLGQFLDIAIGIVDILNEVHHNKIIHMDINPNNILINNEGEIKLADFGSSIFLTREKEQEKSPDQLEGTIAYISPEQTGRIHKTVDYRADYYSLGVSFYELLTGRLPFDSSDKLEIIYAHIAKKALSPSKVNEHIPQAISNIIMKLMSKMPEDRYQSLTGLKNDLQICQESFKDHRQIKDFKIGKKDISDTFKIVEKLYGREEEIEKLISVFEKVNKGGKELVFIEGYSGVGKSALVKELHSQILGNCAYFGSGKFEQFQREKPYSALILALDHFINQLLLGSSDQLARWREKIVRAVENNGKVITEVIPSLKLIIGEPNPIPELGPIEAKNRFNLVFENFIQAIAQKEHPLVLFIDDLQWADPATLEFIKMIMTNQSIKYLLLIGAYRDNKINLLQPIRMMKDEMIKNKTRMNIIKLKPLQRKYVQAIIEDTLISLRKDLVALKELSDFTYNKTQGNPFFVKQFLQSLYDKEYISFDDDLMEWYWDTEQIKQLDITENVVELLMKKINTLNHSTIQQLKNAACIGNQFDLRTMALINEKPLESILDDLQWAVNEGLIAVVKDGNRESSQINIQFRFLHDRIQQAVYSLIPDERRPAIHLHIGRLLSKKYLDGKKTEELFETVRQLNLGKSIIKDQEEIMKLVQLNYKAGLVAKSTSAYEAAFIYFRTAIEMLSSYAWQDDYELTLQLYSEITEMSYLTSAFEKMDQYAEIVLQNAKTLTDKVKVYNLKIQAYQAQLNLQEALKVGISVLKLMGINLPSDPKKTHIDKAFSNVKEAMKGMEVEDLLKLPPMSDPIKLAAMEIMVSTVPTTYKAAPMLTPILTCKIVEMSIKYGNSPLSAGVYAFYGMILCAGTNDIELGYKLGRMSIELIENQNLKQYRAMILEIDNYCIKHWKEHLKSTLDALVEGYRAGMENGDFQYGAYCFVAHAKNSFYIGRSLWILEEEIVENVKNIERIKQGLSLNYEKIFGQLVLNMQGKSKNSVKLTGEMCDEDQMLSIVRESGDLCGMFFLFLSKTIGYYHFGEYALAVESSKKAEENLAGVAGMVDIAILYCFDSLSRLAIYATASDDEKEAILKKVSENQAKMKTWSKYAPMNYLHKFYLIEAEALRVTGKTDEAIDYYEKAISLAKEHEYINDEALANELAAEFWMNKNKYNYAKLHFKEAHSGYKLWGAEAKVKDLQDKYLEIFHEKIEGNTNELQSTITAFEFIDIHTIMKASQAISQEIVLEELTKKLIDIVIENVGAQKVVFIMKEADCFIIKGKKEMEEEKINGVQDIILEDYDQIPKSIINYVSRKRESIILENSMDSINFSGDQYIVKTKPKSILCFPLINQRKLKGILYLENNLMRGAFTRDRLKVLEILSSQIVISLENAKLYKGLERSNEILETKVKARTAELMKERDTLQKYLDIAEVSFLVLDEKARITLINRKGCEISGYSEEEVLGKNIYESFVKKEENEFETLINGELVEYVDRVIITKSGEEKIVSTHNVALRDPEGKIKGVLSCGVDVTEYKLLREQLEYNQFRLELFSNLSHELKTPLNLSFSAVQMLDMYGRNDLSPEVNEKIGKYTHIIKQNNYRLLKLVNNIVDITKISSNSFDLNLQNHDIVELIRKITYSVSDYVENKNRILEFQSNIQSKVIACDPFNIERIILNLLSNAIKFTDEGDKIFVSMKEQEDSIRIVVKDTGIGISKDKQKIIFERFRQVDKSFTRNSEGSGIGLTIVKLLIELHDGEITVDSQLGEFTEFTIDLPIRELEEEYISSNNYYAVGNSLIDRIDIEFSDVYGI
jgi:PAS domain S-box-containing protein